MNKNVLYYSLNIPDTDKTEYYSMLYYSLTTLKKYYNNEFDVVVYYTAPGFKDFTFEQYCHLNKYKIVEAFPFVKFIQSDYNGDDWYMTKWYHFPKLFEMGYEKVLFLDCDTMFFDNPDFMFIKYDDHNLWALEEGLYNETKLILGEEGMNSGQVLISKKIFDKIPNFFETVSEKRKELIEKSEKLHKENRLSKQEVEHFKFFSEQYCAQMSFKSVGVKLKIFAREDIVYGDMTTNKYRVILRRNKVFVESFSVILHYTSGCAYAVLPENLHTPNMKERYTKDPLFAANLLAPRYSTIV